jgi:hypothetical protein
MVGSDGAWLDVMECRISWKVTAPRSSQKNLLRGLQRDENTIELQAQVVRRDEMFASK